jgi:hypothetical protein
MLSPYSDIFPRMGRQRSFDWDEARRLHVEGRSYASIAKEMGVSDSAIALACNEETYRKTRERARAWIYAGKCPDCGAPATRAGGQSRCRKCAFEKMSTVRGDEARCSTCQEWKPLDAFTKSNDPYRRVRGECRACGTVRRREWRAKNRDYENMVCRARKAVASAIRRGILVRPSICSTCDSSEHRIEAHHEDYSEPLEVTWLCSRCHTAVRYGKLKVESVPLTY